MRSVSRSPTPLPERRAGDDERITLDIEAVTPIYRGGARPDAIDPERPFRASAIRGLLRYWWRATREETDPRALWDQEASLFGAIRRGRAEASRVRVGVIGLPSRPTRKPDGAEYVLWVQRDSGAQVFHEGAGATLTVEAPADRAEEVRQALSAWVLLGGIGSRSRRGLGAVHALHPTVRPEFSSIEALMGHLSRLTPIATGRPWPTLGGGRLLLGPAVQGPVEAWKAAVQQMQAVRQYPTVRRWHDDDYVLFAAGSRFVSRRAALGLPLAFQQRNGPGRWRMLPVVQGAPRADRVPSPVHLRPVLVGGRWHPMMAVLKVPYPANVSVRGKTTDAAGTLDPEGVEWFVDAVVGAGWTRHPLGSTQ